MNKEHIVEVETLVSLGVFLRHWTSFEKLHMLLFIKYYTPPNDRFVKHTLFPYFFSLLYAWRGGTETVSSFPLFYLYTTFPHSLPLHFLPLKTLFISFLYGDKKHNVRSITSSRLLYSLAKASNGQVPTFFPQNHMLESKTAQSFIWLTQKTHAGIHLILCGNMEIYPFPSWY